MRNVIWVTIFFLAYSSVASAQHILDQKISVKFKNQSVYHCLKTIESKIGISFSYNLNDIRQEKKKVSQSFNNQPLQMVLSSILLETQLQFKEIANQITIYAVTKNPSGKLSLSGFLVDKQSKEKLIGARLYFPALNIGCNSNAYGYYYIELKKGEFDVIADYIGMKPIKKRIIIEQNTKLNFELEEDTLLLTVIDVVDEKNQKNQKESDISIDLNKISINPKLLEQMPSSNGLPDVTKYIQNIAGIQPLYDGSSSYQVRGLDNGNNLILLDEIPIYHPNHLLGINSVINTNAVKSVNIYKDYIPANFGIRNSSILQIYTKEGNLTKFQASGGLGASVPHISLEGPIIKNKASFYISGRRSFNALNAISFLPASKLPNPDFYDITVKLNYKVNFDNRIYLTSYIGSDRIISDDGSFSWGNNAFSFRWNKILSDKLFTNLTLINSIFNYNNNEQDLDFGQKIISSQAKYDVSYFISNRSKLKFGASILNTRTQNNEQIDETVFLNRNSYETGLYASLNQKINPKLTLNVGVRLPFHHHIGKQDTSNFLRPNYSYETVIYTKDKLYDFKLSLDPRFLLSYQLNPKSVLQWSANVATQFTHILNYNTRILPVQIWVNSSKYLRPERNYQTSFGLHRKEKNLSISSILYYRFVNHVIDFAIVDYSNLSSIESRILSGHLNTFGGEFTAQYQKTKKFSAKLSYNYNYSLQKIDGINNGAPYSPDYSRTHYLSASQYYIRSKKWEFGTNFVFHSPTAITLPAAKYEVNGVEYPIYDASKNTSSLPIHHRLDISIKRTLGIKKQKNRGYFMLTITNIYNRSNISNTYLTNIENKLVFNQQNFIPANVYLYYFIKI
ncbi:MAG: carboxypeptidase-like regulatory domain-containing protein [Crocinitomicaceae bacterium]